MRPVIDYINHLQKFTVASKRIGTRGNPSSPLNPGVSDPEQILKEARRRLSSTSLEKFKHRLALEIPEYSFFILILLNFFLKISLSLNPCSLGSTSGITSFGIVAGDGQMKVHLP